MKMQKIYIIALLFIFSIGHLWSCPNGCKEEKKKFGSPWYELTGQECTNNEHEEETSNDHECPYDCGPPENPDSITCYGVGTRTCKVDGHVKIWKQTYMYSCVPDSNSGNNSDCGKPTTESEETGETECTEESGAYDCGEVSCS